MDDASTVAGGALRLAVFDCDGTLVDSQGAIISAMVSAFEAHGLTPPSAADVRHVVGLALDVAVGRLLPEARQDDILRVSESYKDAFRHWRQTSGDLEPLFPGAKEAVQALDHAGWLLGVATGKSRVGLDHVLAGHGMAHHFITLQTADVARGKPDPDMMERAVAEAGADMASSVMIGDTTYDMEMAVRAGAPAIGVAWGYHAVDALVAAGAKTVISGFDQLPGALEDVLEDLS